MSLYEAYRVAATRTIWAGGWTATVISPILVVTTLGAIADFVYTAAQARKTDHQHRQAMQTIELQRAQFELDHLRKTQTNPADPPH